MMNAIQVFVFQAVIVSSIAASLGGSALAQTMPAIGPQLRGSAPTPVAAASHAVTGEVFIASGAAVKSMEQAGGQLVQRGYVPIGAGETILRLRVDARRNRLWVLDVGSLRVFDLTGKKLVRTIDLPNWMYAEGENCLPDLQVDGRGNAFVSDNIQRKLWRVDGERFSVSEHMVTLDSHATLDVGFSAMTITETGVMYAAMGAPGLLWRVDTNTFRAENILLSAPIYGACALESRIAKGSRDLILFALTAGRTAFRMQRISMAADARVATAEMLPARVVTDHATMLSSSGGVFLAGKAFTPDAAKSRQKTTREWILRPVSTQQ